MSRYHEPIVIVLLSIHMVFRYLRRRKKRIADALEAQKEGSAPLKD